MEHWESTTKRWGRARIFWLAGICLLSGISIWYFAHPPFQANAINPRAERLSAAPSSDMKIMIDQLQQEAGKQAEPLLARLRTSPDDPMLLAQIGKVFFQMRQFPMAAKYYKDSIRLKPDAVVLVKLGGAYHFSGDDDQAINAWNHALRLDPDNPDALFNIGFVEWHSKGNLKAAIDAWQRLLMTNPNHPKRPQVEALLAQAKQHLKIPVTGND